MINYKIILFILILIAFVKLSYASSPDFSFQITSRINGDNFRASGSFIAGTRSISSDSLDIYDGRMIESPGYSIPLYSVIDDEYFMVDFKSSLVINEPKIWHITQRGSSEFESSGTFNEILTWSASNIPEAINLTLIDYGNDPSRTDIVQIINLRQQNSYIFEVEDPYQDYRYFDLIATLTEEVCIENWQCGNWQPSVCASSGIQTKECSDNNNCGTSYNKPATRQSCSYYCQEDWHCSSWSSCISNYQTRDCQDSNSCQTTANKPAERQGCILPQFCQESWQCSGWSNCISDHETRTCTDLNSCGTQNNKPIEAQSCSSPNQEISCTENWQCNDWQECLNQVQFRTCLDINSCGTLNNKPSESQTCNTVTLSVTNVGSDDHHSSSSGKKKCYPNWQCTQWSECSEYSIQSRSCFDANNCDLAEEKPLETRSCIYNQENANNIVGAADTVPVQQYQQQTSNFIAVKEKPNDLIGISIIVLIVISGLMIFYIAVKKLTD